MPSVPKKNNAQSSGISRDAADGVNGLDACTTNWEDTSDAFFGNWQTANSSIATVDYYGTHTGQGVG